MADSSLSSSRAAARLSRSANSCQRCRRRKQKCDLKYPKCTSCDEANVPCLSYHAGMGKEIPRNYLSQLESQVERLTRELEEVKTRTAVISPKTEGGQFMENGTQRPVSSPGSWSNESSTHPHDLVKSMGLVVLEPSNQPRFIGTSSGITLAKMVMAAINCDMVAAPSMVEERPEAPSYAPVFHSSLPPRHVANHLVEVYYQYRIHTFPLLERADAQDAVEHAYLAAGGHMPQDRNIEKDIFTSYMLFAVALCGIPDSSGGRPAQSEGCFHSAIQYLEHVFAYSKSDLETLGAVLLLAQYVSMCPSKGSLWQLTGTALRLCIDMGLHWETDSVLAMDPGILNERRRLFWATYRFDRVLAITLGRPFGIVDQSINVEYPYAASGSFLKQSTFDGHIVHSRRVTNHLTTLSRLESEIKHVLYHQLRGSTLAYPKPNYALWVRDIQPRLQEWYASIPSPSKSNPQSIFASQSWWDALYNNTLLLLHRPNPLVPSQSPESLRICFEASCKSIRSIKVLQREQKIDIVWIWVHHLFMAGLTVTYCLWHSKDVRNHTTMEEIIDTLQSCAIALSALSERFPGAIGCRNAFESLSSATINWLIAKDSETVKQTEEHFGKQWHSLQQQLPGGPNPPLIQPGEGFTGDMFTTLSNDSFLFGESLNSAAQWPGPTPNVDFPINIDPTLDAWLST